VAARKPQDATFVSRTASVLAKRERAGAVIRPAVSPINVNPAKRSAFEGFRNSNDVKVTGS
jgi:hypothetical protein